MVQVWQLSQQPDQSKFAPETNEVIVFNDVSLALLTLHQNGILPSSPSPVGFWLLPKKSSV
jgi:hypothetical protein